LKTTVSSICFLVFLFVFDLFGIPVHIHNSENSVRIGQQKLEDFYGAQEKRGKASKDRTNVAGLPDAPQAAKWPVTETALALNLASMKRA